MSHPPSHARCPSPPAGLTDPIDASLVVFITNFFRISDDPNLNDAWLSHFTPDAHLVMGNQSAKGRDGM